jgi:biopolymer transport protein ExbB/TolQ
VQQVGYYLTHPAAWLAALVPWLFTPALIVLIGSLMWVVFQAGVFTVEVIQRHRARRTFDVDVMAEELAVTTSTGGNAAGNKVLDRFRYGPILPIVVNGLEERLDWSRIRVVKLLNDAEQAAARRLEWTRAFIRIGPVLGLITTLIPISPALVALSKGDIQQLSASLIVVFSTTVIGLLIGTIGYVVSVARERVYGQDLSDLEYVLERGGV